LVSGFTKPGIPASQIFAENDKSMVRDLLINGWLSREVDEERLFSCLKLKKEVPFSVFSSKSKNAGQI